MIQHWLIVETAATELKNTPDGSNFIKTINNANTYEIVHSIQNNDPLPHATHVESFPSYRAIQSALVTHQILPGIKVILYDNESWPGTPLDEQQRPFTYVPLAENLVHHHRYLFMNAPAADLKSVLDPKAQNNYTGYLQMKLATLAQYTDIFEIQAQNAPTLGEYLSFAKQAIKQARKANGNAIIIVGITAKKGGPSSQMLYEELKDINSFADGCWLNIIGGSTGVSIALPLIQMLQSA